MDNWFKQTKSSFFFIKITQTNFGEVQASYWDKETLQKCKKAGIELL